MKKINSLLVLLSFVIASQSYSQNLIANDGDINYYINFGYETVDNLNCASMMDANYSIEITNSVLNDTVFVIYNGFSQQDTVINTAGAGTFLVSSNWPNSYLLNSFSFAQSGIGHNFSTQLDKIICNGDTLIVSGMGMGAPSTDPGCTFSSLGGRIYIDNDLDCAFTSGDNGVLSYVQVNATYSNGTTSSGKYTNANGIYNDNNYKSDGFISATLKIPSLYNFAYSIPSCSQAIYTVTSLPATGIDFARECAADIDLRTYVHGLSPGVRPLIPFNLYPNVSNIGCLPVSGLLKLTLDPNVTYSAANSSNPADSISGNALFWHYTNLTNVGTSSTGFWNQFFGGVELTPNASVNIGDFLSFQVETHVPGNDANPGNNTHSISIPVVNSYDPNVKNVEPKGEGVEGFISATTSKLIYTIDFQNTGNADALNVYILDTLEGNVIPNTLKIIDASHTMNPQWLKNNILKFNFPSINLPDSTSNEPASHGFVTFEIDMVQGLAPGVTIENTAYIYFDANPAIITNTAKNTIEYPTSSVNELNSSVAGLEVIVYPNPMSESTTFLLKNDQVKDFSLELYDMTGKLVVQKQNNNSRQITINRTSLQNGVYIYKIVDQSTNKASNGKLIIQ